MKKQPLLDANGKRKFGIRDSIAYAAGDLGCNMSFALKGTMSIFWTQFMGMDIWYALLLIVVQVWDAINDPLIGTIIDADRRKYKRNKFLTYIWVGSIGLIVGGACCFLPFPDAQPWAKALIFIFGYVVAGVHVLSVFFKLHAQIIRYYALVNRCHNIRNRRISVRFPDVGLIRMIADNAAHIHYIIVKLL